MAPQPVITAHKIRGLIYGCTTDLTEEKKVLVRQCFCNIDDADDIEDLQ